ncbi:acyltransferase [Geopsychrobacter electrodiphilus]|uniref:acyltransferase n=1 Tax=Geopsychrobacter electrodiphilus TaxID=225196 RepID=UPI00037D203D|nr:DapH/DapD/GlmU-related protein [Geopsychrobacter electrodiphilus]
MTYLFKVIMNYFLNKQISQRVTLFNLNANIGENFKLEGDVRIKNESGNPDQIVIGDNCKISASRITCKSGGFIEIGNYSVLQDGSSLLCLENIRIGSFTGIAAGTTIIDNNTHAIGIEKWVRHRIRVAPGGEGYSGLGNGWEESESAPIVIGDGVWVGTDCTILKGVTVGDGAIIARNSVVTKDVAPFTVVAGNPAKKVKDLPVPEMSVLELGEKILSEKTY